MLQNIMRHSYNWTNLLYLLEQQIEIKQATCDRNIAVELTNIHKERDAKLTFTHFINSQRKYIRIFADRGYSTYTSKFGSGSC